MTKLSRARSVAQPDLGRPPPSGAGRRDAVSVDGRRRPVVAAVVALVVVGLLVVNTVLVDRQSGAVGGQGTMQVEGTSLFVRQDGARDAPAVVLIHGLGGSTDWWDSLVPLLATSHHIVRIDLLGHGRSAKPTGAGYSIPDQARRVGLVLDQLGVRHAIVVGHSTGGLVATSLAEQRRDMVSALTLIDIGPSLDAFVSDGPIGRLLFTPVVGQLLWRVRTDSLIRKGLSTAFSRHGYQIPQQFVDDVKGMTFHALTATSEAGDSYLGRRALPARLVAVGRPLLVIFGAEDQRWHVAVAAAAYRGVPGAHVELLAGVGHSPMLEDPPATAALILGFVATVPRSRP